MLRYNDLKAARTTSRWADIMSMMDTSNTSRQVTENLAQKLIKANGYIDQGVANWCLVCSLLTRYTC